MTPTALEFLRELSGQKFNWEGKEYLLYEAWTTLARFFNLTPKIEWTRPIMMDGKIFGWEARAVVVDEEGKEVASAEAMCAKDEKNWSSKPFYALRSMAQTRAIAKALRSIFSWVVVLAGFAPTPAEEMDADYIPPQATKENEEKKKLLKEIREYQKELGINDEELKELAQELGIVTLKNASIDAFYVLRNKLKKMIEEANNT